MTNQQGSFRERGLAAVRAALGEPEVFETSDGPIYRWTLRGAEGRVVRLLVNSPEFPGVTNFNISDNRALNPLTCQTARSIDEVEAVLARYRGMVSR